MNKKTKVPRYQITTAIKKWVLVIYIFSVVAYIFITYKIDTKQQPGVPVFKSNPSAQIDTAVHCDNFAVINGTLKNTRNLYPPENQNAQLIFEPEYVNLRYPCHKSFPRKSIRALHLEGKNFTLKVRSMSGELKQDTLHESNILASNGLNLVGFYFENNEDTLFAGHLMGTVCTFKRSKFESIECTIAECKLIDSRIQTQAAEIISATLEGTDTVFTQKLTLDYLTGPGHLFVASLSNIGTEIVLKHVKLDLLRFADESYNIKVDSALTLDEQISLYEQLRSRFKDNYQMEKQFNIYRVEKMYEREHDYITPKFRYFWNDFGYNKYLIFRNSIFLMFLFLFINWIVYPKIMYRGYCLTEFARADRLTKRMYNGKPLYEPANLLNCFYFTFLVFWGIKLDFTKMQIRNKRLVALILLQYVFGLICIGYIAKIIITN